MAIVFGKIKCVLCDGYSGVMESVHGYGIYQSEIAKRIHYHPECLELIQMYPESFHSLQVDMSLHIIELRKKNYEKVNSTMISGYEEKIAKLKSTHFEKMMPSKT